MEIREGGYKTDEIKDDNTESVFIKCDCHMEALELQYWKDEKSFYISFWDFGRSKVSWMPWTKRIKMIWRILKGKDLYADMVIIDHEKAKEIVEFINNNVKEDV